LEVLLQMRHLALKLLTALLGSSLCLPCHSKPALITMTVITDQTTSCGGQGGFTVMITEHSIEGFLAA